MFMPIYNNTKRTNAIIFFLKNHIKYKYIYSKYVNIKLAIGKIEEIKSFNNNNKGGKLLPKPSL